jgi:hypothetical protein
MKRGIKSKKAQFFVIFAVILGILILAAASVLNFAKSEKNIDNFQVKCENYKNEVFEISKYAANGSKDKEFSLIKDFSTDFIDYMNNRYNISMYFLYGNSIKSIQVIIPGDEIPKSGQSVDINYDKFKRNYLLNTDNSFHFLMIAKKNNEVYVCE